MISKESMDKLKLLEDGFFLGTEIEIPRPPLNIDFQLNSNENEEFEFQLDCFDEKEQEDMLWKARTGLDYDTLCGAVETIIFMNDRPVTIQKIKSFIDPDIPLRVVHESITKLQREYEEKHHGIRLQEVAEGYQFRTKATYSKYVQDLFKINSLVLTPSALEVLAIVAYKQPVSKMDVEKIRGVDSSHIVRALMDKRLVKIVGRSEDLGKPLLFGTTLEFLEVFNLNSIDDLPPEFELKDIANTNEVGEIADIKQIVTSDKSRFDYDDIHELDDLKDMIKAISSDTEFTKSLNTEGNKKTTENDEVAKSAFELLEEHVYRKEIKGINQSAVISEVLTSLMEPRVVDVLLEEGTLNAPDISENSFSIEDAEFETEEDRESIKRVLEEFGKKEFKYCDELELMEEKELDSKIDALEDATNEMMEKAKNFDIDLSFLNEEELPPEFDELQ